jgi:hypothetical protein
MVGVSTLMASCSKANIMTDLQTLDDIPNQPLTTERIAKRSRDTFIDESGEFIFSCFDNNDNRSNELFLRNIEQNTDTVLRFPGFHTAYGAAISQDGKFLSCCVQNGKNHNYLLVINREKFTVEYIIHTKHIVYFMPIFINNVLHYFKSDLPGNITMGTRFNNSSTESFAKDEVFRFYMWQDGIETQMLDHPFYHPQWVRQTKMGLLVGHFMNEYANKYIDRSDPCLYDLRDREGNRIVQIDEGASIDLVGGDEQRTYLVGGNDQGGLFDINIGLEAFFTLCKGWNVDDYQNNLRYRQLFSKKLGQEVLFNNDYSKINSREFAFYTSNLNTYLFHGRRVGFPQGVGEYFVCDEKMNIIRSCSTLPNADSKYLNINVR